MKMRFHRVLLLSGCSAWICAASAATDAPKKALPEPEKSVQELILNLSDQKFRVREEATRKIWAIGDPAVPELEKAAAGKDPESAYRAREVLHKIQLYVTPETDPEIITIVERYAKAQTNEKLELFTKLQQKRAWRQVLKIYAAETDAQVQAHFLTVVDEVAVVAARECLLKDEVDRAREFLEMAPANASGLLALADFHRSQGTLAQELIRAKGLPGIKGAAWRLALHRAAGDLEAAREAATAAGETGISATIAALQGDPLPWLRYQMGPEGSKGGSRHYTALAIKRWGQKLTPADIEPVVRESRSTNPAERLGGIGALFLLGESAKAEQAYFKVSRLDAFGYLDTLERVPEALKVMELDPVNPDYKEWVKSRFAEPDAESSDDDHEISMGGHTQDLLALANFLERRGLDDICMEAFGPPLGALAEKDEKGFVGFLGMLFGQGSKAGSPRFARTLALEWAGEDDKKWDEIITAIFAGQDETISLWDWLAELDPKATRTERFDGLLALCNIGTDPGRLAEKWKAIAWSLIDATEPKDRKPLLDKMFYLASLSGDAGSSLKVWDALSEKAREEIFWSGHVLNLTSVGRWEEAADFYLKQISVLAERGLDPQPGVHAYAASTLRKAGRMEEALEQDKLVEKLALGRDANIIADGYSFGCDYERGARWRARAVCQTEPGTEGFNADIKNYLEVLLDQGAWKEAASLSEVFAGICAPLDFVSTSPLPGRQYRFQSDFCRAMANLKTDRSGSIASLAECHRLYPTDGGLADYFFPALRSAGLIKEHDEWFHKSWDVLMAMVKRFPDCDNLANSAGWLASRAERNLPEAEKLLDLALSISPNQYAYLDTMAEIQFARGRRQKAVEWSTKAMDSEPNDSVLRRQHERFLTAPLPR